MWCSPVKFGGDSGAAQQVSDIGGGFGRVSFTPRSRGCRGIVVKREIIAAAPLRDCSPAMPTGHAGTCAATSIHHGFARRMRFFFHIARICAGGGHLAAVNQIAALFDSSAARSSVGWAKAQKRSSPAVRRLSAFAHPTRLTLLGRRLALLPSLLRRYRL